MFYLSHGIVLLNIVLYLTMQRYAKTPNCIYQLWLI